MGSSTEKYLGRVADTIEPEKITVIESFEGHKDFALRCSDEEFLKHQQHFDDRDILIVKKQGLLVQVKPSPSHKQYRLSACPQCWGDGECSVCEDDGRVYLSLSRACKRCSGLGFATSYSGMPSLCHCASMIGVDARRKHYREFSPPTARQWTSIQDNTYTEKK